MKVGIAGAGQLGRMLGLAAIPLGMECEFLDSEQQPPAASVGRVHVGKLDDAPTMLRVASSVDVLTPEIENIDVAALQAAATRCPVHPNPAAIGAAQDRSAEKRLFASLNIPTAAYVDIERRADLRAAAARLGWPIVLKARRLGYDGRGQRIVESTDRLEAAWQELACAPAIAEGWVDFECEVSLIGVRGLRGEIAFYPLTENVHRDGILRTSVAPYDDPALQSQAESWLAAILQHFDYCGILTVEFFLTADGLVANEMAPRVHNSGHWTIEGAETSQFENHLRAITGLPLGVTRPRGHAAMVNLIGTMPERGQLLAHAGAHLHDYGKAPRVGRKLGHCTLVDSNRRRLVSRLERLRNTLIEQKS